MNSIAVQTKQTGKFKMGHKKEILLKAENAGTSFQRIECDQKINNSIGFLNQYITITLSQLMQNIQNV